MYRAAADAELGHDGKGESVAKDFRKARAVKRNAKSPNALWRQDPATEFQWKVLRRIGRETRRRFPESITRGEASEIIGRRFAEDPAARRRHRRAQAQRRKSQVRRDLVT
jgi:hypothetical protein